MEFDIKNTIKSTLMKRKINLAPICSEPCGQSNHINVYADSIQV